MENITFAKNGVFVTIPSKGLMTLIKFENIFSIEQPNRTENNNWKMDIRYSSLVGRKSRSDNGAHGFKIVRDSEEKCNEVYQKLIGEWMKYHNNSSSLEEKIDKLLSHIEVLPGGEEYNKAEMNFERNK